MDAYTSDLDSGGEVHVASYFCPVHAVQDFAEFGGQSGQHLWAFASHAHEADFGFWVCLGLGREDEVDGILLSSPSRWSG